MNKQMGQMCHKPLLTMNAESAEVLVNIRRVL